MNFSMNKFKLCCKAPSSYIFLSRDQDFVLPVTWSFVSSLPPSKAIRSQMGMKLGEKKEINEYGTKWGLHTHVIENFHYNFYTCIILDTSMIT